jgi:transcriptional regulator with XRE-family HTH domain
MVTPDEAPSVVRRRLGRRLRRLREAAGKRIDDVTTAGVASRTKMWRIEHGQVAVRMGDVLALARLYDADNAVVDQLLRLAEATKSNGYVEYVRGAAQETVWIYADLEASAAAATDFNSELVPGLLQAEEYIRAIMYDDPRLNPEDAEKRIAFRRHRQRAFFERPRPGRVDAVITAGALNLEVGSPAVMEAQRGHLRVLASGAGASIRVLPADNGLHPRMTGPFTIFDFDDPDDPPVACVENVVETRYFDRTDHVAQFRAEFAQVRAQAVPIQDYLQRLARPVDSGIDKQR